jgi:hypothetical protein
MRRRILWRREAVRRGAAVWSRLGLLLVGLLAPSHVLALPSFAWQTGQPCAQCHVHAFGPALTSFGRQFKLNGYVWERPDDVPFIPIAGILLSSFTHTAEGQPGGAAPHFHANDNVALDQLSLYYAGKILPNVGAFVQGTYDGFAGNAALDNVDIRFVNQGTLAGKPLLYGVSLNNNPTVQDVWNTTPAWGFPYASSPVAPTPAAAALIDGGLASQVVGLTAYGLWNQLLYVEGGAYRTLPATVQRSLGIAPTGEQQIDGVAPYWRIVVQREWSEHYLSVGTFGLYAPVFPGREHMAGHDHFTDLGADMSYQFQRGGRHLAGFNATFIAEEQHLTASHALGNTDHTADRLKTFRAHVYYTFAQTYGVTLGYFQTTGRTDRGLYQPAPITGSASGSPNSRGFITEVDFIPFGRADSFLRPWLNVRLSLQYVAYIQFNGAQSNYDGFGRDASANNTLYLLSWFAF